MYAQGGPYTVSRRRNENISDSEIALELRESGSYWFTIGKCFNLKETTLSDDTAYSKRAKALVRKLGIVYNERIKSVFSEKEYSAWVDSL